MGGAEVVADGTKIEWTEATWNPITGCSIVSPGCTNCYAMKLAGTRLRHHPSRAGLTKDSKAGPVWTGDVRLNEQWLLQPLRWSRPRAIFVCAHGDLFHESVPDEWIDRVFAVMALSPQHTFQVLTKRSARMRDYLCEMTHGPASRMESFLSRRLPDDRMVFDALVAAHGTLVEWPLPNVWLGVSAERQQEADERIPDLLSTPAAVRFVSAEPLLGPIDLTTMPGVNRCPPSTACEWCSSNPQSGHADIANLHGLDWIIVGGESGPGARPMHPDWARSIRDQCQDAGVPFFFKQWGAWLPSNDDVNFSEGAEWAARHFPGSQVEQHTSGHTFARVGKVRAGRLLDGKEWSEMPC